MTTQAKLVLMRHGETDQNRLRLMTGQSDVPLNKLGEEQARAAGPLIKDIPFDKAYSSSLSRAFNTAALALKAAEQDIPIERRKEIIEGDAGEFTGRNMDTDPEFLKFVRLYDTAPPGGESDKQLVARVQKFFDEEVLPRLKRGENVLVVSHAGTVRAFDIVLGLYPAPADGTPWPKRRPIPNAGPSVHEYEDGVLKKSYDIENPETTKAARKSRNVSKFRS